MPEAMAHLIASAKRRKTTAHKAWDGYQHQHARAELDSHADTCAFGSACRIVYDTGDYVSVEPFEQSLGAVTKVPIVTAAVAYDNPIDHEIYILIFPQSLYIPTMDTHLLSPFQIRHAGVEIKDIPLQQLQSKDRTTVDHAIHIADPLLSIPLSLKGTMSGFTVRKPTQDEIEDAEQLTCTHIYMTQEADWNPHDHVFQEHEEALRRSLQYTTPIRVKDGNRYISPLQVRGLTAGSHDSFDDSSGGGGGGSNDSFKASTKKPNKSILRSSLPLSTPSGRTILVDELDKLQGTPKEGKLPPGSKVGSRVHFDEDIEPETDISEDEASVGDIVVTLVEAGADLVYDPKDKTMKPRPSSRVIHSVETIKNRTRNLPLDVDQYAERLLIDTDKYTSYDNDSDDESVEDLFGDEQLEQLASILVSVALYGLPIGLIT